ncbi:MAG: radical SAM protein [Candidatus Nanoarchaeia archaeon]|nr:radical SAM protein [Candidatus Nanoarchaeia archaeon]
MTKKFSEIYREISFEEIEEKWENVNKPINVYIHSPFCKSICKFCYYKGTLFNQQEYERYYDKYLPKLIEMYKDILEKKEIKTWFFGGGTPSLLDTQRLEKLFSSLPNFKQRGEKTFELHPAFWSMEQLDILKKYNFDNVIIGIQTFDQETLKNQNRIPATFEEIKKITEELKKRNIRVSYDIIGFLNDKEDDRKILRSDLELAYELNPDEITVQTHYDYKEKYDEFLIQDVLTSSLYLSGEYLSLSEILKIKSEGQINKFDSNFLKEEFKSLKTMRFFKEELSKKMQNFEIFKFIKGMDEVLTSENDLLSMAGHVDPVLGIGSYKNKLKNTFSNLNSNEHYVEINYDNNPKFYMVLEHDFFREMQKLLEIIKKVGPPPRGVKFNFENQIPTKDGNTIYQRPFLIKYNIFYDYLFYDENHKKEIQEYMNKLSQEIEIYSNNH